MTFGKKKYDTDIEFNLAMQISPFSLFSKNKKNQESKFLYVSLYISFGVTPVLT
jgi:hypothetical protein